MSDTAERFEFQAETARLLKLMAHSVYSEKEVFLRELVSNAADACDKLRYEALSQPELLGGASDFRIELSVDKAARTLTVADNGVGMSKSDLIDNLGVIAQSGTARFADALSADSKDAVDLIGQFGVGFYSVFIVADRVEVTTRRAGENEAWLWSSDGSGAYEIAPSGGEGLVDGRGAAVRLHLRDDAGEFLEAARLTHIIKSYSDHTPFPILLKPEGGGAPEKINSGGALWRKSKSDVSETDYKEFYHSVCGGYDTPWRTIHYAAEGRHEYSVLLFIPTMAPFDLYDPARRGAVKLYVKRVAITDDASLLPPYLRFVRGVVDSQDMPLNISREMLQNNPIVASIRGALTKRVLSDLSKAAEKDADGYAAFWRTFGAVLKEGVYEDFERRDELLKLLRFKTTNSGGALRSLDAYLADAPEGQKAIYFLHGEHEDTLASSPQLEGYRARGLEVLLLTDPVDGFWTGVVSEFAGKPFRSVTQGAEDLGEIPLKDGAAPEPAAADSDIATLIAAVKTALGDAVCDVRKSNRLTDSPVCMAAKDGDADLAMQRMLGRDEGPCVLELNPGHPLIRRLADQAGAADRRSEVEDAAHLLLAQAQVLAGRPPKDAAGFAQRLSRLLLDRAE